jgi:hypothetical protein
LKKNRPDSIINALGVGEGTLSRDDLWASYLHSMRSQLAHDERLGERLRYFVGDGLAVPSSVTADDARAWLELVAQAEELASQHLVALRALLAEIPQS